MISIANSIDYLNADGLPLILCAWIGLLLFNSPATFFHELGHIFSALILTQGEVMLRVGEEKKSKVGKIGRIHWQLSLSNGKEGFSGYDRSGLSRLNLFIIIISGPIASLMITITTGWFILYYFVPTWVEVMLVSWFCANALVFIRSAIPVKLKPTASFTEGPPSDGLQLLRILRGKE